MTLKLLAIEHSGIARQRRIASSSMGLTNIGILCRNASMTGPSLTLNPYSSTSTTLGLLA